MGVGTGWLVMLGAVGALAAAAPADLLAQGIGWRGLFVVLAGLSALASLLVLLAAPHTSVHEPATPPSTTFSTIYKSAQFWRVAPLSALGVGTSWSLQGLWAAPWLRDVEGLDRSTIVHHLSMMAVAVCAGALLLGTAADRLRAAGVKTETVLAATLSLSIFAQTALMLQWPLPPLVPFLIIAAAGAATVLSFPVIGAYFPKAVAGRANGALNMLHVGCAFAVQTATGFLIVRWPESQGSYPAEAHRSAMAIIIALQLAALVWFAMPRSFRRPQMTCISTADVVRPIRRSGTPRIQPAPAAGWRTAAIASTCVWLVLATILASITVEDTHAGTPAPAPWSTVGKGNAIARASAWGSP
ncbi:MAG: MFS transporter [Hyphomicrobiaceae bacterium]